MAKKSVKKPLKEKVFDVKLPQNLHTSDIKERLKQLKIEKELKKDK